MSDLPRRELLAEIERIVENYRLRHQLTYARLAELMSLSRAKVYRFATGDYSRPPEREFFSALMALPGFGGETWSEHETALITRAQDYDA